MSPKPRKNGHTKNGESKGKSRSRNRPPSRPRGGGDTLRSGLSNPRAPDIIDSLTDTADLPDNVLKLLKTEFNKHHALGNYTEQHLLYRRYQLKNTQEIVESHFPPKESIWQGEIRKEANLGDGRTALTPEQRQQLRDSIELAYSLSTRSGPKKGLAQQTLLANQTSEKRIIEEREPDQQNKSWLEKIIG